MISEPELASSKRKYIEVAIDRCLQDLERLNLICLERDKQKTVRSVGIAHIFLSCRMQSDLA